MIALLAIGCFTSPESSDSSSGGTPARGTAVAFDEVLWGEASPQEVQAESVACVTAFVQSLTSEKEWEAIRTSWLADWAKLPSFDWASETVLVAYIDMCTSGGHDLEMTDVWETGAGTLQVDLTYHRGRIATAEETRPFSIATVPKGEYVATANVTESHDDTGFGSRD